MKTSTTKPLIWKGELPQLIYCEPDKKSVLKIEEMSGGNIWYAISCNGMKYDSFFGKTVQSIKEAKTMCEYVYNILKEGKKPELLLHNKLP